MKRLQTSLYAFLFLFGNLAGFAGERPNVVIIMVDDMGFSDIGAYGSEIETPNLDQLSEDGVKFSSFYNTARCCPTRAALLTGLYPHEVGIGYMANESNDKGAEYPGYRGHLLRNNVTMAEVLQEAGYATLASGKWHVGNDNPETWPLKRGFEKFYGFLGGKTNPFSYKSMLLGNESVGDDHASTTDRPYYASDAFADYAIQFINEEREGQDRPFFLYWADNAPHYPLFAPEEETEKYLGQYDQGWDELRAERFERQKRSGLMAAEMALSQRPEDVPAWDSLTAEQQRDLSRRMVYYAAMIDRLDQDIGRLMEALKANGQYENTLIMFLSDNGGCEAGRASGKAFGGESNPLNLEEWLTGESKGASYGIGWAGASNTPFRQYKISNHEGGIASPFIVHWPAGIPARPEWYRENASVIDIAPTIYELAGAEYPTTHRDEPILALRGVSLVPAFAGEMIDRESPLVFQHGGNAALIDGEMKLVGSRVVRPDGSDSEKWELYNLAEDPAEENDLAMEMPELKKSMEQKWLELARDTKIFPRPVKKKTIKETTPTNRTEDD